ncbi:MAG: ferritin-like domain-containing protein [Chitinophagales bacterium]
MNTSLQWYNHFKNNLTIQRVDWNLKPEINATERANILQSLQAWQLGETSEGTHLMRAAHKYSKRIGDSDYPAAVELFIKEEQKHGNNLGKYLGLIGEPRIEKNWGDTLFRKIRYFNTSMELWTLAVITVESTAQIFYQSLKDATNCALLKQICTDILIDEAKHIDFQLERLQIINAQKNPISKFFEYYFYVIFYFSTISVVWLAHKKVFKAGGLTFTKYFRKIKFKFDKTILKTKTTHAYNLSGSVHNIGF